MLWRRVAVCNGSPAWSLYASADVDPPSTHLRLLPPSGLVLPEPFNPALSRGGGRATSPQLSGWSLLSAQLGHPLFGGLVDREANNEDRWLAFMLVLIFGADHVDVYPEGCILWFDDDEEPHDGP